MPPPNLKLHTPHSRSVCLNWLCCWLYVISGLSKLLKKKSITAHSNMLGEKGRARRWVGC